jgi:DNA polymerase-3 subunit delta'
VQDEASDSHADYLTRVPLIPLYGHEVLRRRLAEQADRGALPSSLLFQGPAGVGKQRLALWLGQRLLCEATDKPCGECQHCRYVSMLQHPDLRWFFPRPRISGGPSLETIKQDADEALRERAEANGLYARPSGSEGIFVDVTRLIVQMATRSPAMAARKVFVVGDAERMVSQEGADSAANAFLKLLEEPLADTTVILTSSEPGTLLPTIRSRVVAVRVAPLDEASMHAFVSDPLTVGALPNERPADLVRLAAGAPGSLVGADDRAAALARARQFLAAADGGREQVLRAAFTAGSSKARGRFADVLDALTVLVHERARDAAARGDGTLAMRAARAVPAIEDAKRAAEGNANPQLVTAQLLEALSAAGSRA